MLWYCDQCGGLLFARVWEQQFVIRMFKNKVIRRNNTHAWL